MSRAIAGTWVSVVAGLVVAPLGVQAAPAGLRPLLGAAARQAPARPAGAKAALTGGIECHRRGDFEQAAALFQEAQNRQKDLSELEKQELGRWQQLNNTARTSRREGSESLRKAEQAAAAGRNADAVEALKKVVANPYLSAEEQIKGQQMMERLRPRSGAAPAPAGGDARGLARSKLQQARGLLAQGNHDAAEQLAREADRLGATYGASEDTPRKVLDDVSRAKSTRTTSAKPPAKVPTAPPAKAPAAPPVAQKTSAPAPQAAKAPVAPAAAKDKTVVKDKAPAPPAKAANPKEMLRVGREQLEAGKFDDAAQTAQRARAASAAAGSWSPWGLFDDSPDALVRDVNKARARREQEESVKVLAEARRLYERGDYDQASTLAYRAQKLHGAYSVWDLGDRPTKLLAEIETARAKSRKRAVPPVAPVAPVAVAKRDAATPPTAKPAVPAGTKPGAVVAKETKPVAKPNKEQATRLLADARDLQKRGMLVEARGKAVEAQKLRAVYGPDEDSPDRALIQLASLARRRMDNLVQQATDLSGQGAGGRKKAEEDLMQAELLAKSFGLDTYAVDTKLRALRNPAAAAPVPTAVAGGPALPPPPPGVGLPAPPPGVVVPPSLGTPPPVVAAPPSLGTPPVDDGVRTASAKAPDLGAPPAPVAPQAPAQSGKDLMDKARLELRSGQTANARKLAETVFKGPYGMQAEASNMLRSIDVEEFNQKRLDANRAFDAGLGAFNRRDFAFAGTIFRNLDAKMLDTDKQGKLKELMMTPELQPSAVARADRPNDAGAGRAAVEPGAPAVKQAVAAGPDAGVAKATDQAPESDLMAQTKALQDVKYQQLRAEGLRVMNEAGERFRAGDTARALEMLQDYVGNLPDREIDPANLSRLKRPVDSRIQQFRLMKAQRDFEKSTTDARTTAESRVSSSVLKEENKKKKIAELMKEFNTFFGEGKYKDAQMKASLALELDPDNPVAAAAVNMARTQDRIIQYQKIKSRKEEMFVQYGNAAEDPGALVTDRDPLAVDVERMKIARQRDPYRKGIGNYGIKSEMEKQIEQRLLSPVNLNFSETTLRQAIDDLRDWQGINIVPDVKALNEEGIALDRPVTLKLEGVSLKSALNILLDQVGLTYVVKDEALQVTTKTAAKGKQVTMSYSVADLVIPVENFGAPVTPVEQSLRNQAGPQLNTTGGTVPYVGSYGLAGGQPAGSASAFPQAAGQAGPGVQVQTRRAGNTTEDTLIKLITGTIAPRSWESMGGPGTIDFFPLTHALVINQTPDIQEQVADLLASLRRLQDQEVAVEVRFISIAEAFFERIGLDFNINIKTDQQTARFEPQITSGQFKPAGFINDFNPSRFITGLTPQGTFTGDLDIPIRTSSFGYAIPPFGAFPNFPGNNGGIELGLAFLSDIQVFLFMEAAQGDQRTNVMQAPKLTLFNGQTASITVTDQQFFVTSVLALQQGGQLAFVPQNNFLPTGGVTMTLNAVISADRRYVRLSVTPTITNIASAIVPLFPIVTPIIPILDGGFQGPPVLFTQFLQQPVFNTIMVMTTVAVPDGGTVLIGGLKRLSEGRNEFGPPVLSKIPYVNRLFKNVGYGREVTSLLIMVTPRIIINEEEQERQTGVRDVPQVQF